MSYILPFEWHAFEAWILENYPDLFEEWEVDASHLLDLDEWLDQEYYYVLDKWRRQR